MDGYDTSRKRPREADTLKDALTESEVGWKRRGSTAPLELMKSQVRGLNQLLEPVGYELVNVEHNDGQDAQASLSLLKPAFPSKDNHNELDRAIRNKDRDAAGAQLTLLLLREEEGQMVPVSTVNGRAHQLPVPFFEIAWMATNKSCRGQGVGRLLTAALKTLCHLAGVTTVLVHVDGPQRSITLPGQASEKQPNPPPGADGNVPPGADGAMDLTNFQPKVTLVEEKWVCCDKCDKWRILDPGAAEPGEDDKWFCTMLEVAHKSGPLTIPGDCGQRELTAEETAVARDPALYLAEEDDSCFSIAKKLDMDPKSFVHANRQVHGNFLTGTMKFKEGTVLVLPTDDDVAQVKKQEEEKEAKDALRRAGRTPGDQKIYTHS